MVLLFDSFHHEFSTDSEISSRLRHKKSRANQNYCDSNGHYCLPYKDVYICESCGYSIRDFTTEIELPTRRMLPPAFVEQGEIEVYRRIKSIGRVQYDFFKSLFKSLAEEERLNVGEYPLVDSASIVFDLKDFYGRVLVVGTLHGPNNNLDAWLSTRRKYGDLARKLATPYGNKAVIEVRN
ncbi:MAG: hypothetical protein ACOCXG_03430 [Nanoarchaeota archaeon]